MQLSIRRFLQFVKQSSPLPYCFVSRGLFDISLALVAEQGLPSELTVRDDIYCDDITATGI